MKKEAEKEENKIKKSKEFFIHKIIHKQKFENIFLLHTRTHIHTHNPSSSLKKGSQKCTLGRELECLNWKE